jgi:hypothetical protein
VLPVCQVQVLRRKKGATRLSGATSGKVILASNKRCHVQGVRGETGAAGLPGATGEKGILKSNKKVSCMCRVCGGRQALRACLAPQGRRGF